VWHAPDSQIYPELRRMEAEGLVEAEEQVRGERGTRRLYHVTDVGDRAFLDWMNSPLDYQRVRDPAHLRAAYLESARPDQARAFLERHIAQWEGELAQWEGELRKIEHVDTPNPMLERRLAVRPEEEHERIVAFKHFAYEGLVDRARGEIGWARRGLSLLADLEQRPAQ
jgi:PadR family transcriptional regulator, regulatory protein AphA